MILTGTLQKLNAVLNPEHQVEYAIRLGTESIPLNGLLGQTLTLTFTENIFCTHCGKKTKKSYQQGYCFICATTLARCDICMVRPEKCHFHLNTCREPDWGKQQCFIPHIVYLANTSHLKVGITREIQIPRRWIDQGATEALPLARVTSRREAGLLEVLLAKQIRDKTDWRAMLKGENESLDLQEKVREIQSSVIELDTVDHDTTKIQWLKGTPQTLKYPVLEYPKKIQSLNTEKEKHVSSVLMGIKGQYLIFEQGVLNMRNLAGYEASVQL